MRLYSAATNASIPFPPFSSREHRRGGYLSDMCTVHLVGRRKKKLFFASAPREKALLRHSSVTPP
ncbi:hypothetical protein EYF80_056031 [Liparis tanakae]|uniref:Uncharacterized protein n=1 Tax=Liparis tanakae TaxID=230148 RepID=A0A4Z2EXY7_9TELE|nr:hypothetical protein EYF80_056031 [Liparis tanakae]